jgi:hypothetical protein
MFETRSVIWVGLAIAALVCVASCHPQTPGRSPADREGPEFALAPAEREELVAAVLAELDGKYVFPEVASKNHPVLAKRWADDAMNRTTSSRTIMARMNADLQELFNDKHVRLLPVNAIPEAMLRDAEEATPGELAEMAKIEAREHFGIARTEIREGNIGYLELVHFPYAKLPGTEQAISESMGVIRDTRALIVDLRNNHGGDGDTVTLYMSYLFDKSTLLSESYDRLTGKTTPDRTRTEVRGHKYGEKRPLWVLTSSATFSGGEAFAYAAQTLQRGTIVGEKTGGGGHYNKVVKVGRHFLLSVAVGMTKSPITHTNWDGVGVTPDVATSADEALDAAMMLARKTMRDAK